MLILIIDFLFFLDPQTK